MELFRMEICARLPSSLLIGLLLVNAVQAQLDLCPIDNVSTCLLRVPNNESFEGALNFTCSPDCAVCGYKQYFPVALMPSLVFVPVSSPDAPKWASPGNFKLKDIKKQCVLKDILPCPPGFYCPGGSDAPAEPCVTGNWCPRSTTPANRSCPPGFFCVMPTVPNPEPCPGGSNCPDNTSIPMPCKSSYFCKSGSSPQMCPTGSYCPYGSEAPTQCEWYHRCPRSSASPGLWLLNLAILSIVLTVGVLLFALRNLVPRVASGSSVVIALVVTLWLCDSFVGMCLFLYFVLLALPYVILELIGFQVKCVGMYLRGHGLLLISLLGVLALAFGQNDAFFALNLLLMGGMLLVWRLVTHWRIVVARCGWALVVFGVLSTNGFWITMLILGLASGPADVAILTHSFGIFAILLILWACSTFLFDRIRRKQYGRAGLESSSGTDTNFAVAMAGLRTPFVPGGVQGADQEPTSTFDLPEPSASPEFITVQIESAGLAQECPDDLCAPPGISFQLRKLGFRLSSNGDLVLQDVSLDVKSGHRVAIMGPSGCGKTTLLSVLSNRVPYGTVEGQVLINGQEASLDSIANVVGFVPQDDIMHGELTVFENVYFHACLRLGIGTSQAHVNDAILNTLEDLGMLQHRGKLVGTEEARGISGGQRKRVSIAMEMVIRPRLLFLDEPTSGLDSAIAMEVVAALCAAAGKSNCTTLAVIHQPRFSTLLEFDDVVLLAPGGHLVYAGSTQAMKDYFVFTMGYAFPSDVNPADAVMDCLSGPDAASPTELAAKWRAQFTAHPLAKTVPLSIYARSRPSWAKEVIKFLDRSLLQTWRSKATMLVNLGLIALGIGLVCVSLPIDKDTHNPHPMDAALQMGLVGLLFMLLVGVGAVHIFSDDRVKTWREASCGMSVMAYFVGKDCAAIVDIILNAFVFTIVYGSLSGTLVPQTKLFAISFTFVWAVYGFTYMFAVSMSANTAQMVTVFGCFIAYAFSGTNQPTLLQLASIPSGWMFAALSPVRWFVGYLLTMQIQAHVPRGIYRLTAEQILSNLGYDLDYVSLCSHPASGETPPWYHHRELEGGQFGPWQSSWWNCGGGWVCEPDSLFLLGVLFRLLAFILLDFDARLRIRGWLVTKGSENMDHSAKMLKVFLWWSLVNGFYVALKLIGMMRQRAQYRWIAASGW